MNKYISGFTFIVNSAGDYVVRDLASIAGRIMLSDTPPSAP